MSLRSNKELQFSTCICGEPTCKLGKAKKGKLFCRGEGEVGRGFYKQNVHWKKLGVSSIVAFHWLSYDSLSLAELLPGNQKIFLPSAGGSKVVTS